MELLTLLRTIAPEFEDLEDTTLQTWLDLTQPLVSKSAFGAAYEQADPCDGGPRRAGQRHRPRGGDLLHRRLHLRLLWLWYFLGGRSGFFSYSDPVWIGVPALAAGDYPYHGKEEQ